MAITKHSERNLKVLENFILHITHSSEGDHDAKIAQSFSPNDLYELARGYIAEDHVDGEGNDEDFIVTYGAESSFNIEDPDKKYLEHVVVVANYGDEVGTKTIATIDNIENLTAINELLEHIKYPYKD
jgi:hypothetical protein